MDTLIVGKRLKANLLEMIAFALVILLLMAGAYWRNQLWNNQIEFWTDCVRKSPNKSRPHINLSTAYFESGQYDRAFEVIQKAIKLDPKSGDSYYNLGLIYQKMGDLSKAIAMEKKALELDPTLDTAYYALGRICFENGQYEESEKAFQKFLQKYPYFPEVHNLLAIVYAAQKKFDKAVPELEWEVRINPNHVLAHLNLGQIYWYEFQNRQKAIYHLKVALMLDPFFPTRTEIRKLVRLLEGLP
jgi:tetratricopeptide (TPR) repeat protein